MASDVKYFFILSFSVNAGTGLAIIVAGDEKEAFEHLKESGQYNCSPEQYQLLQIKNIGDYCGPFRGLALESYTNALQAFEAFVSVMDKIIGPQGEKGDRGEQGPTGQTGMTPMIEIGNTVTLDPGYPVRVELTGTTEHPRFSFYIPKGPKGDTGSKGDRGEKGDQGEPGDIVSFSVGTVTELPIGSAPTVTITQSADKKSAVMDFGIPKYDIAPDTLAALKAELKLYIDGLVALQNQEIQGFESDVNSWVGDIERVVANALVRHEQELSS